LAKVWGVLIPKTSREVGIIYPTFTQFDYCAILSDLGEFGLFMGVELLPSASIVY